MRPWALSVLIGSFSALGLTLIPASASKPAEATWLTDPPPIDGAIEENQKPALSFDSPAISVTASNSGEWLYLAFTSKDSALARSILMRGLKLEITANDGKPLSIGYPLAHRAQIGPPPGRAGSDSRNGDMASHSGDGEYRQAPPFPPGEESPHPPEGSRQTAPGSAKEDESFNLFGPGKDDVQHIALQNDFGLTLRTQVTRESFVYEIQVPLTRTEATPYAVGAAPGDTITVTLKTLEKALRGQRPGGDQGERPDDSVMIGGVSHGMGGGKQGGPGGMRGGSPPGIGGAGGGMGGGPGGHPGGRGGEPPRESSPGISLKAKVLLATPPAADRRSADPKTGSR